MHVQLVEVQALQCGCSENRSIMLACSPIATIDRHFHSRISVAKAWLREVLEVRRNGDASARTLVALLQNQHHCQGRVRSRCHQQPRRGHANSRRSVLLRFLAYGLRVSQWTADQADSQVPGKQRSLFSNLLGTSGGGHRCF